MRARAMAAREPSNPARGTQRRTALPKGASATLKTPINKRTMTPTRQAKNIASSCDRPLPLASCNTGNRMKNATPNVLGVSSPSGIAVTSGLPVRRANRNAIQV